MEQSKAIFGRMQGWLWATHGWDIAKLDYLHGFLRTPYANSVMRPSYLYSVEWWFGRKVGTILGKNLDFDFRREKGGDFVWVSRWIHEPFVVQKRGYGKKIPIARGKWLHKFIVYEIISRVIFVCFCFYHVQACRAYQWSEWNPIISQINQSVGFKHPRLPIMRPSHCLMSVNFGNSW